ncbi:MAG: ribosome-binding factor A [Acidobacteriota bacterium]
MRRHNRVQKNSPFIDPDFAEALDQGGSGNSSSGRQAQRKTEQFCRQVQRALNLALEDRSIGDGFDGLFVEAVLPVPDCGHLLVQVMVPSGFPVADAIGALRREAPRLRAEVASAISRKRAPELSFVPAYQNGGSDE